MSDIQAVTYDGLIVINPSDSAAQFSEPAAGFIVTAAGTVSIVTRRDVAAVVMQAAAGVVIPVSFVQIKATGTSATGIVALTTASAPYRGLT